MLPYGYQRTFFSRPVFLSALSLICFIAGTNGTAAFLVLVLLLKGQGGAENKVMQFAMRSLLELKKVLAGACCRRQCNQTNSSMALFRPHHHATTFPSFTSNNCCFFPAAVGGKVEQVRVLVHVSYC